MAETGRELPGFDQLVSIKDMPKGCAWGLWDTADRKDVFGCLNHITPDVVKAAYLECKEGESVSLNWRISGMKKPGFGRKPLVHRVLASPAAHCFDDEIEFNTQCSSQWDSLVHFHHQASAAGYNGVRPTEKDLTQDFGHEDHAMALPTLNHWHTRGGLVTRGVLIDYKLFADEMEIQYDPCTSHTITVQDIERVAARQGVAFRTGDVLIVRMGYTETMGGASASEQTVLAEAHQACGVEGSEETARWVWNHRFACVAGDMVAFEVYPPRKEDGANGTVADLVLHQYFLALFGLHIGELWDLRKLSETCQRLNRYTFLLTSIPLNVPGAIGSPPNALALF